VTTEPREQHEPSMEEILSSIRRIIADEEAEDGAGEDELGATEAQMETTDDEGSDDSEDVLELTRVVRDGGEVVDLRTEEPSAEPSEAFGEESDTPTAESARDAGPEDSAAEVEEMEQEIELAPVEDESPAESTPIVEQEDRTAVEIKQAATADLISATTAGAATGAFAKLSEAFRKTPPEESVADDTGRTVEQFVEDMVRPAIKEWLDEHLPAIVERLVAKEIEKIARRAELM
jgi:cell pole-organizing protein PopZ